MLFSLSNNRAYGQTDTHTQRQTNTKRHKT